MKYVIYGAGKRGKIAFELIEKDNIYAFVDRDDRKIGTKFCDVPVIALNTVKDRKDDVLCIVSPYKGVEEIILNLQENGITNYIKLQQIDIILKQCKQRMEEKIVDFEEKSQVVICGISVSSLLIFDRLKEMKHHPIIAVETKEEIQSYSFLEKEYEIKLFDEVIDECEAIIYLESNLKAESLQKIKYKKICVNIRNVFEEQLKECEQIQKYKKIHFNKRCFIVATGPSLRVEDLELLEKNNEICISMNRIYNIFKKTTWRPMYYMIQDLKMIDDLKETIAELDLPVKFVSGASHEYWELKESSNSIKFNYVNLIEMDKKPFFSERVDKCIYEGMTVTYACLQMAVYMGFREIYLLGLDHNYSNDLYADSNHFTGYDTDKKIRLNTVHIGQNELAYVSARKYAEQHGIKIYNATRGGKLEVFERKDFDSLF